MKIRFYYFELNRMVSSNIPCYVIPRGLVQDSNPGPHTQGASILPLDQRDMSSYTLGIVNIKEIHSKSTNGTYLPDVYTCKKQVK